MTSKLFVLTSSRCSRMGVRFLMPAVALAPLLTLSSMTYAQSSSVLAHHFAVLHKFNEKDGLQVQAPTLDKNGNIYAGTNFGGHLKDCPDFGIGCGLVFEFAGGRANTLFRFNGKNGESVDAPLLDMNGTLYGTTDEGGDLKCPLNSNGCGVVFGLESGTYTEIHKFAGSDGNWPEGVIADSSGNLYGVTVQGGKYGYGTVYELQPSGAGWSETVLYNFTGGSDGRIPNGDLVFDDAGNLYGATLQGGGYSNGGTIFEIDASHKFSVLYSFTDSGGGNGDLLYKNGMLYGSTTQGGAHAAGTVFELDISTNSMTTLYTFTGGLDGAYPSGGVVIDASGNLDGITNWGGSDTACQLFGSSGCGVVFKVNPSTGQETVLHDFNVKGGALGIGPLAADSQGNLYGMTYWGGDLSCNGGAGCGVLFEYSTK